MIGRTIDGRYTIVRLLGQGAMGAVYEARHAGTNRRVALKVILDAGADPGHLARFHREARAVGGVESDHIAQVFDTGTDVESRAPYIAMEYLEGEDLQNLLTRLGPLPVDLALRITYQACLGLAAAHGAGVVHRDIKPANIFLVRRPDGQRVVKLLDFGVAKVAPTEENHQLTRTGALMGSPLYMSPEQARGGGGVDARSDLWSLGITLFECLTGRRLNEDATGLGDLLISICTKPAPPTQSFAPWVPAEVGHAVDRALRIDPAERYPTANDFASTLAALLPHGSFITEPMLVPLDAAVLPGAAPQPQLATSAMVPPTTLGTTGANAVPAAPHGSRTGLALGAAAAVLALAAVGVFMAVGRSSPRPAPAIADTHAEVAAPTATTTAAAVSSTPLVVAPAAASATPPAAPSDSASAATAASTAPAKPTVGTPAGKRPAATATPGTAAARPTPTPTRKPTDDDETSRK
jgi:serine/threonine-protein kinase